MISHPVPIKALPDGVVEPALLDRGAWLMLGCCLRSHVGLAGHASMYLNGQIHTCTDMYIRMQILGLK